MPHKDPARAKEYERQRYHRRTAERRAQGLCSKCGKEPPEPERSLCTPCAEKKRKAARARYAKGKAEGMLYGGRNVETRRRNARARDRRYRKAWREANLCTRCGKHPGGEGGTVCEPCKETRRMAERQQYAARRAAGRCGKCGHPAFNGVSRCGPCSAVEAEYNPTVNHLTSGGRVANLSITTDESYIDRQSGDRVERTEWHRVVTFQPGLVDMFEKHARKGRLVYVAGKLQTRRWKKDGEDSDRFSTEILLVPGGRVQFLDKPNGNGAAEMNGETMPPAANNADTVDTGDIPF